MTVLLLICNTMATQCLIKSHKHAIGHIKENINAIYCTGKGGLHPHTCSNIFSYVSHCIAR